MRPRRPSAAALERLLAEAKAAAPTYPEIGATRTDRLPAGYRHDHHERRLGSGDEVFDRAVTALRAWHAQIGAGVELVPKGAHVDDEDTVVLVIRALGLWATLPCRVIYVDEAPREFAFAYGTLPGHPEQGEVRFAIERDGAGGIAFRIASFSRTVDPLARLGSPFTRRLQQQVTERYLDAIAAAAAGGSS